MVFGPATDNSDLVSIVNILSLRASPVGKLVTMLAETREWQIQSQQELISGNRQVSSEVDLSIWMQMMGEWVWPSDVSYRALLFFSIYIQKWKKSYLRPFSHNQIWKNCAPACRVSSFEYRLGEPLDDRVMNHLKTGWLMKKSGVTWWQKIISLSSRDDFQCRNSQLAPSWE